MQLLMLGRASLCGEKFNLRKNATLAGPVQAFSRSNKQ